ncbi:MAG: hypothetical protein RLZ62_1936, partial [Bacteroidota bacterium]
PKLRHIHGAEAGPIAFLVPTQVVV